MAAEEFLKPGTWIKERSNDTENFNNFQVKSQTFTEKRQQEYNDLHGKDQQGRSKRASRVSDQEYPDVRLR